MPNLKTNIRFLKGVGDKKAELLAKELGITTIDDLLGHYPFRYIDRSRFYKVSQVNGHFPYVQLRGVITQFLTEGAGGKMRLKAFFKDDTGVMELVWFKGAKWIRDSLSVNKEYIVFGKPNDFRGAISIPHPEVEDPATFAKELGSGMQPVYGSTEKLKKGYVSSKFIQQTIAGALKAIEMQVPEVLTPAICERLKLLPRLQAIKEIHFPSTPDLLRRAEARLKFEELFWVQLKLVQQKKGLELETQGFVFNRVGDSFNRFYKEKLPFELTGAQKRVIKEIRQHMGSGRQMNRLLQGDVGSGKTLVALMAMLLALDNGFQACLIAPTEILAQQHYVGLSELLFGLNVQVRLLTGSSRKKERDQIHATLLQGSLQILVGTHAVMEDVVQFKNLGLVVIDEQHRFGVAQRARMWQKNTQPPHVLVMTATPIPRTLAMTVYGDLDVSVIDELPPGRKPINTWHKFDSQRLRVFAFMKEEIAKGRQVYVVYPLIKESENMDYKDLHDGLESITRAFPPPQYTTVCVHGQMKNEEKDKAMQLFVKGQAQIMVATTVIEVGVNVPNASMMVIESAERFGLSQLHQLRGRVGRGAEQSYCILMTGYKLSKDSKHRIQTMCSTNDGFEIAEADLKLRGPGDMEGTQQSGVPVHFRIANLAKDGKFVQIARQVAIDVLDDDPRLEHPENQVLVEEMNKQRQGASVNWREIS